MLTLKISNENFKDQLKKKSYKLLILFMVVDEFQHKLKTF